MVVLWPDRVDVPVDDEGRFNSIKISFNVKVVVWSNKFDILLSTAKTEGELV